MSTYTRPAQQVLRTKGPVSLDLELAAGEALVSADLPPGTDPVSLVDVEPFDHDDPEAIALAEQVRARLVGDQLQIHVPRWGRWRGHPPIRITVRIPIGSAVNGTTAAADIAITGELAGLSLRSASGAVNAELVSGDVGLSSASGDVGVQQVRGSARIRTASGQVVVGTAVGPISASTASGAVRVGEASSDIDVATASGDIEVRAVGVGRARLQSASGGVRVGVRAGTQVQFDVVSGSGFVHSTLAEVTNPTPGERLLELRIRTASGRVNIDPAQVPIRSAT